ncbi:hypothetical protein IM40_07335 [Candidatus Paracaedimonas acanthamoebae]|nr:hypothetical protein IM40_07335 [Candidatus Paracaedimonas acanthamoebae]
MLKGKNMLGNVSLNFLVSKTIYLTIISFIFFSGNACFSTEEFTVKEQEIRQNHLALKEVVEGFYTKIEEKSFLNHQFRGFQKKTKKALISRRVLIFVLLEFNAFFPQKAKFRQPLFR